MMDRDLYKIIGVSNFDKESVSDIIVCESISDKRLAERILDNLNTAVAEGRYFYRLVPQTYTLYIFDSNK